VRLATVGIGANSVAPLAEGRRRSAVRYADEAEAGRSVIAQRADQDALRRKQRRVVVFASGRDDRDRDAPHSLCPPLPRVRRGLEPSLGCRNLVTLHLVRFRQNVNALIRDEYGSQALFLAVAAAVRVRVAKKTTPAERPCNIYRERAFCVFRLDLVVPRDSVEMLAGKILIHRLNHACVIGQKRRADQKKLKPPDRT